MKKNLIFAVWMRFITCFKPIRLSLNAENIEYPFGAADNQGALTFAAALTITVKNAVTFASVTMTADMTLAVTKTPGIRDGAVLYLLATSDATARAITGSTNVQQASVAGVISKTKLLKYVMINGTFYLISANQVN